MSKGKQNATSKSRAFTSCLKGIWLISSRSQNSIFFFFFFKIASWGQLWCHFLKWNWAIEVRVLKSMHQTSHVIDEMRWPVSTSMSPSWLSSACKQACGYVLLGNVISSSSTLLCYSLCCDTCISFWKCCPSQLLLILWHPGKTCQELDQIWGRGPSFAFRGTLGSPRLFTFMTASGSGVLRCSLVALGALWALLDWRRQVSSASSKSADFFAGVTSVTSPDCLVFAPNRVLPVLQPLPWWCTLSHPTLV